MISQQFPDNRPTYLLRVYPIEHCVPIRTSNTPSSISEVPRSPKISTQNIPTEATLFLLQTFDGEHRCPGPRTPFTTDREMFAIVESMAARRNQATRAKPTAASSRGLCSAYSVRAANETCGTLWNRLSQRTRVPSPVRVVVRVDTSQEGEHTILWFAGTDISRLKTSDKYGHRAWHFAFRLSAKVQ